MHYPYEIIVWLIELMIPFHKNCDTISQSSFDETAIEV